MSLLHSLMQYCPLSPADTSSNIWTYTTATPAANFHYFILPIDKEEHLLCSSFKTGGDNLIHSVLCEAAAFLKVDRRSKPLSLFSCSEVAPFDTIAVLSCEAHLQFKSFSQALHSATSVVFPIYRCEFRGDETPDIVQLIRRDFLPSLEWERKPHPTMRVAFNNPQLGLGSQKAECLLASLVDTRAILKQMDGQALSWLRVQNWREEELMIKFKEDFTWSFTSSNRGEFIVNCVLEATRQLEDFCILNK